MAQRLVDQHERQHGFGNRRGADADTGIVPTLGGHLDCLAANVDRAPRLGNGRGRLDRHVDNDILTGRYAAEDPSGVVADEALRQPCGVISSPCSLPRCATEAKPAPISTPLTALMPIIAWAIPASRRS